MRIWIVGGGSLGLLLASDLAGAGCPVRLLVRTGEQAVRIGTEGVAVREPDGRIVRRAIAAAPTEPSGAFETDASAGGPADWIALTVKQHQLDDALIRRLAQLAAPHARICAFQNGIGHPERLARHLPPERFRAAVTTVGARRTGLAEVERTGTGVTWFGRTDVPAPWDARDRRFAERLAAAGWPCEPGGDMRARLWDKLVINSIVNPLTAILGVPNGELLRSADTLALMRELFDEAANVARAEGVKLSDGLWETTLDVLRRTAANRSSMLQDVERGRPTELAWITGSLLAAAERHGVAACAHRTVYRLARARERAAGERGVSP